MSILQINIEFSTLECTNLVSDLIGKFLNTTAELTLIKLEKNWQSAYIESKILEIVCWLAHSMVSI